MFDEQPVYGIWKDHSLVEPFSIICWGGGGGEFEFKPDYLPFIP
jgi:hypothetical protein